MRSLIRAFSLLLALVFGGGYLGAITTVNVEQQMSFPPEGKGITNISLMVNNQGDVPLFPTLSSTFTVGRTSGEIYEPTYLGKFGKVINVKGAGEPTYPISATLEFAPWKWGNLSVNGYGEIGDHDYSNQGVRLGVDQFFWQKMTRLSLRFGYHQQFGPADYYLDLNRRPTQASGHNHLRELSVGVTQIFSPTLMGQFDWSLHDYENRPYGYLVKTVLAKAFSQVESSVQLHAGVYIEEDDLRIWHRYGVLSGRYILLKYTQDLTFSGFEDAILAAWFRTSHEQQEIKEVDLNKEEDTQMTGFDLSFPWGEQDIKLGFSYLQSSEIEGGYGANVSWQKEF